MKPAAFDYHAPRTVKKHWTALELCEDGSFTGGGQSLVPTEFSF